MCKNKKIDNIKMSISIHCPITYLLDYIKHETRNKKLSFEPHKDSKGELLFSFIREV